MRSEAKTIEEYLAELPPERAAQIAAVREVVVANLPDGYEEVMNWGMITYQIPLKIYPDTYNKQPLMYVALASQKNHMAVYLSNVYGNKKLEDWFRSSYEKSGKKLDMGKSCVRFKKLEDLPLDLIGKTIAKTPIEEMIAIYEGARP